MYIIFYYLALVIPDEVSPSELGMEANRQYIIEVKGERRPPSPIILSNGNYTIQVQVRECIINLFRW